MSSCSDLLMPGQQIKPQVCEDTVREIIETNYGLQVKSVIELVGYDDKNYRILCKDQENQNPFISEVSKDGYVLKIINSLDSQKIGFIDAQTEILFFLNQHGIKCPVPQRQSKGLYYGVELLGNLNNKQRHVIRFLLYRPGELLNKITVSNDVYRKIGSFVAKLNLLLQNFHHPALENHHSLWSLNALPHLRNFTFAIENVEDRNMIEGIIGIFEEKVLRQTNFFDHGVLHGDLNADNIVMSESGDSIEAVIDFGDIHKSCLFFELAICICYMIINSKTLEVARYVIEGYQSQRQLTKAERHFMKLCVCARFAQTIVLGTYSHKLQPNNQYLIKEENVKWAMIKKLWPMDEEVILDSWGLKDN